MADGIGTSKKPQAPVDEDRMIQRRTQRETLMAALIDEVEAMIGDHLEEDVIADR